MTLRVLGLLALAFLFSQGDRLPAYAQQPSIKADSGSVAIQGHAIGNTIITGYTFEQHERIVKERVQELRELHQAELGQSQEHRKTIERQLQVAQGQLGNLQKSYEERVAELIRTAGELAILRGQVPEANLQQALDALAQGRTKLADALFAEVENKEEPAIERAARAAFERGRIAYQEVRWQEARSHFEKADRLVPDNAEYSGWAARIAHNLGDYGKAVHRYEAILDRFRKGKGEALEVAIAAANNLALLYHAQGRSDEAEPVFKKLITIYEEALPAGHPVLAIGYNNLAGLYHAQGRSDEAEPLYKKAIAIHEKVLPADHPALATGYNNVALLYHAQGRSDEAEPLYKKAIAIHEKVLPADHPDLAIGYNNLAELYRDQGRSDEAERLYRKALEILEQKLGPHHPNTITASENLADLLRSRGHPDEADALLKRLGAGTP
jgi:tetratricopeptide (TPR) repeat protein